MLILSLIYSFNLPLVVRLEEGQGEIRKEKGCGTKLGGGTSEKQGRNDGERAGDRAYGRRKGEG